MVEFCKLMSTIQRLEDELSWLSRVQAIQDGGQRWADNGQARKKLAEMRSKPNIVQWGIRGVEEELERLKMRKRCRMVFKKKSGR